MFYCKHSAPHVATAQNASSLNGLQVLSLEELLRRRDDFINWPQYVLLLYLANCNKHKHFYRDNLLFMVDNDKCFLPEFAFNRVGVDSDALDQLIMLYNVIFASECSVFHSASGMLGRAFDLYNHDGGLSHALRDIRKERIWDDLDEVALFDEIDRRVMLLAAHAQSCFGNHPAPDVFISHDAASLTELQQDEKDIDVIIATNFDQDGIDANISGCWTDSLSWEQCCLPAFRNRDALCAFVHLFHCSLKYY